MQRLEAEQRLTDALAQIAMMKKAATDAVLTLRDYLFMWLTPENQERVKRMLRFYKQSDQTRMMSALLTYLMFGEKKSLPREVERWHMKLICDHIDSDAISSFRRATQGQSPKDSLRHALTERHSEHSGCLYILKTILKNAIRLLRIWKKGVYLQRNHKIVFVF